MRSISILTLPGILLTLVACQQELSALPNAEIPYDSIPIVKPLNPVIAEASGIADSKTNPGFIWVNEDSGNAPWLYLLGHDGVTSKTIYIKQAPNRDWEDIALSKGKIYIGDIGDNTQSFSQYYFYIFPEPAASVDTVYSPEVVRFKYPDGSHDAEAFLVDPVSPDIYVITKRDMPAAVYRISYPYSAGIATAVKVATLPYFGITSAAFAPDGKSILIRTYLNVYRYSRTAGKSIADVFGTPYKSLKIALEPQGEAITFGIDNKGFYTLSEKGFANFVNLNYYKAN